MLRCVHKWDFSSLNHEIVTMRELAFYFLPRQNMKKMQIFTTIVTKNVMPWAPFDPSFRFYHKSIMTWRHWKKQFFQNQHIRLFFKMKRESESKSKSIFFQLIVVGKNYWLFFSHEIHKNKKKTFTQNINKTSSTTYNTKMFRKKKPNKNLYLQLHDFMTKKQKHMNLHLCIHLTKHWNENRAISIYIETLCHKKWHMN
jgi:hypothetical protein